MNSYAAYFVPNGLDPNGTDITVTYSRPGDDPGEIYETASLTATLKEDTSACGNVPDPSKGDPKDPKCPTMCAGKVKLTLEYKATLSTDEAQGPGVGANYGLENGGSFGPFAVTPGPGGRYGTARGTAFTGSVNLGEIDCSGGTKSGTVRASVGVGGYADHEIDWKVVITSCGKVDTEELKMHFAAGTRATQPLVDVSAGSGGTPYPPAPPGNTSAGPVGGP